MKMNMTHNLILALGLTLALPVLAHDDATLDAMASPHGGQLRMAGPYHFELVVGEGQLDLYVTDHAMQPTPLQGVSGTAIVLSGGKSEVPLQVGGDNRLHGSGGFATSPEMKVVVSLTFPDATTWQARFTPGTRQAVPVAPAAPMQMGGAGMGQMDHTGH